MDRKITELLMSRLCHELGGVSGALHNGIELVADNAEGPIEADVLSLLQTSSTRLLARLKFYRKAYGLSRNSIENISELRILSDSFFESDDEIEFDWPMAPVMPELKNEEGKLILNLLILAKEMLAGQGGVDINIENEATVIQCVGKNVKMPKNVVDGVMEAVDSHDLNAKNIHAQYCYTILSQLNFSLQMTLSAQDEEGQIRAELYVSRR